MNRSLVTLTGLSLFACLSAVLPVAVREASAIDLPRTGGNNRDGIEVARGDDGDTISYTINETADTAPPAGPPAAPAAPDLSRVPVSTSDGALILSGPTSDAVAPVSTEPAPVVSEAPVAAPTDAGTVPAAPAVPACSDYPTWYDAQVDYEAIGGLAAAAETVASLDPDYDGVACEELI